jgi:hypothetical protein
MLVQGERVREGLRYVDGRAVFRTCRVSTGQIDDHRRSNQELTARNSFSDYWPANASYAGRKDHLSPTISAK